MKKIIYMILTVFQGLFLIGAYAVQDYSMKRMGMMRHVIFYNRQWESEYAIKTLQNIAILSFVLMTLLIIFFVLKRKSSYKGIWHYYRMVETVLVTSMVIGFILLKSTEVLRAYYFICLILLAIMGIQYLKQLLYLINLSHKEKTR